jgi:transposase
LFEFYIKKYLLKYLDSSKTVLLDTASPHKNKEALALIRSTGAKIIFLPPYRPELNPIEYCWSGNEKHYKKIEAENRARADGIL